MKGKLLLFLILFTLQAHPELRFPNGPWMATTLEEAVLQRSILNFKGHLLAGKLQQFSGGYSRRRRLDLREASKQHSRPGRCFERCDRGLKMDRNVPSD